MSLGQLHTNKSWPECIAALKTEFDRWGIEDYILPTKRESQSTGVVEVSLARNRVWAYPRCGRFPTPEQNLMGIVIAIEGVRKAEQRGIGALFSEVTKLLALTDGTQSPRDILGVRPGETDLNVLRAAYTAALFQRHPDHGGSQGAFKELQDAARELGVIE